MTKRFSRIAAVIATVLCAGAAFAQPVTLRISSPTINDAIHDWMKAFKAGVEARAQGRLRVEMYPASQLGSIPVSMDNVALGTLEMAATVSGFGIPFDARFQILDIPGLFDSVAHSEKVFNDPDIRKRLAAFGASRNMETLWSFAAGEMVVASHRPIRKVADFRGLKVRVTGPSPMYVEPFKNMGASPVALSLVDVLPALQNRTIDGAVGGINYFPFVKYYDVTKNATYLPQTWAVVNGIVSRQFLKSVGAELETIIREESRKAEPVAFAFAARANKLGAELWTKNGGEIIRLDEAEAQRYLQAVNTVVNSVLAANPSLREPYEALAAASKRLR
jgi:TRAP-type C4-dicarboxylate transport system substrate-binding protein